MITLHRGHFRVQNRSTSQKIGKRCFWGTGKYERLGKQVTLLRPIVFFPFINLHLILWGKSYHSVISVNRLIVFPEYLNLSLLWDAIFIGLFYMATRQR